MFLSKRQLPETVGRFLVITAFLINTTGHILDSEALFAVPNRIKSSSQVEIVSDGSVKTYLVEEFIDIPDANVRVVISNDAASFYADDYTSYFRINERAEEVVSDHLIAFSHRDQLCKMSTIQTWKLSELTNYLSMLYESYKFNASSMAVQNTSIGPTALLQFVQINAGRFVLKGEVFVEQLLKDMYLFEARDYSVEGTTAIVVICLIPKSLVGDEKLDMFTSSLANLESEALPSLVMILELNSADNYNKLSAKELYEFNGADLNRLKVEFDIVHERVSENFLSLELGALDFRNPFAIPRGAGCSSISGGNTFKIAAKQFSGAYEAKDMPSERYIAYDEHTSSLRLDTIDEYKLVYNTRLKRIIYTPQANTDRCVTMSLQGKDPDKSLTDVGSMKDVMGFDEHTPLVYLGTMQLQDGTHCVVFEREIYPDEVPLLVKLNLRLRVYSNSRVFLTFYFTSDGYINNYQEQYAYRGLWLKRIELLMMVSVSKYKILCSEITFSQSSWDLESIGTRDAPMLHPARAFDTLECFALAQQDQIHLQVDMTQDVISEWTGSCEELAELSENIEEGAVQILVQQLGVSRSQVNQIELMVHGGTGGRCVFKLSNLLVNHLSYIHESSHIGWIDNMNTDLFKMHVNILTQQEGIIRSECFLKLASEYQDSPEPLTMVHCVGAGFCGYLKSDKLSLLDFTAKEESGSSSSPHVCEIHKVTKSLESNQMIEDKLARNNIERTLRKAYFSIQLDTDDPVEKQIKSVTLRLRPTAVAVSKGGGPESLGTLVASQVCFSNDTHLVNGFMGNMNVSIIELTFDKHHWIVYCHRACQMSPNCITYSYSSSDRKCSLSNIPLEVLSQFGDLSNLRHERSCQMYLMNSMYLFESINIISYSLLSRLAESTHVSYYLTLADRDKCANLCHWNTLYCSEFYHSLENRVCAFEDQNQSLYKALHLNKQINEKYNQTKRFEFFMQQVGEELWNKTMTFHLHKTDYSHFYIKNHSSRVDYAVVDPFEGQLIQLSSIYDLTYSGCLRECTIKSADCVVVDFCNSNLGSNCKLFRTNDKYLFKLNQITLDDLATLDKNITTESSICTHHYLKSNSFALKRQLSLLSSNVSIRVKDGYEDSQDEEVDEQLHEQIPQSYVEINFETVMKILSILVGVIVGFVALNSSAMPGDRLSVSSNRLSNLFTSPSHFIRNKKWLARRNRSESVAQLELEVVREDDEDGE